jgi:hypothetical protein
MNASKLPFQYVLLEAADLYFLMCAGRGECVEHDPANFFSNEDALLDIEAIPTQKITSGARMMGLTRLFAAF